METSSSSKISRQRTRLNFQRAPTNIITWNLHIKILFTFGHPDKDKDRLQHPEQKI